MAASLPIPVRDQVIPTTPYSDNGNSANNYTLGRHTYFGNLYIVFNRVPYLVGGMQAFSVEESNQTRFIPSAGSDWLEPVFGMRQWTGDGSRFQIRGNDLQQIARTAYNVNDIDWRFIPFIWQYSFEYASLPGASIENTFWSYFAVWITRYRTALIPDPFSLISEDFSFIAKGYRRAELSNPYLDMFNNQKLVGGSNSLGIGGSNPNNVNSNFLLSQNGAGT